MDTITNVKELLDTFTVTKGTDSYEFMKDGISVGVGHIGDKFSVAFGAYKYKNPKTIANKIRQEYKRKKTRQKNKNKDQRTQRNLFSVLKQIPEAHIQNIDQILGYGSTKTFIVKVKGQDVVIKAQNQEMSFSISFNTLVNPVEIKEFTDNAQELWFMAQL